MDSSLPPNRAPGRVPAPGPIRTCVGCRAPVAQAELVRIATVDGKAVADARRRLPGRGAYVHARPACLAAAAKGGLARSLRRNVTRAEVDGLKAAVLGDPCMLPPGQPDADAVEIGTPSSTAEPSTPRSVPLSVAPPVESITEN